jgi:hypothetical protein
MTRLSKFAYVQVRLQSRYSQRANEDVWLRLHNIHDLSSYLQIAQQTPLRQWTLGIDARHSSHEIELALRQKYRNHIDEISHWVPADWQKSVQWVKRLADLPVLHYLLSGGASSDWMKCDPDIRDFTVGDSTLRLQAMTDAGYASLVIAWQQNRNLSAGWISDWKAMYPKVTAFTTGLQNLEHLLQQQLHSQLEVDNTTTQDLAVDYESITNKLAIFFRHHAFQPAAVYAYLAIIAIDLHRVRADLLQRLFFNNDLNHNNLNRNNDTAGLVQA